MKHHQHLSVGLPRSGRGRVIRLLVSLIGGAVICIAFVAAAEADKKSATHSGVVNVTYWNMWTGVNASLVQSMVDDFNYTHPTIHVNMLSVPASDGDTKLVSSIAAGDPPDVFTEWNPQIGTYASTGAIQPLAQFMTGPLAGAGKWLYHGAAAGGTYNGKLYGFPMSMNSLALYYNKSILKQIHAKPPTTFAQLNAEQAKLWKISGNRVTQIGMDPLLPYFFDFYQSFFHVKSFVHGRYDMETDPGAIAEMKWLATFKKYPYQSVQSFSAGFSATFDSFIGGKEAFFVTGPWEGYSAMTQANPILNFGVESFPAQNPRYTGTTDVSGNYNIIPKGAAQPQAAFTFIAWMAGYHNEKWAAKHLPQGGWMPPGGNIGSAPAFKEWINAHPGLAIFAKQLANPYSIAPAVTPAQSQYEAALNVAIEGIANNKMTVGQALRSIDDTANKALGVK